MSLVGVEHAHHGRVAEVSTQRAAAGLLTVAGMGLASASLLAAAPGTPLWPVGVLLLAALGAAFAPDTSLGALALGAYAGSWLLVAPDERTFWALPAACGLLVVHAALAWAAAGPATMVAERDVLRHWLRDLLVVAAIVGSVWLVPQLADQSWRSSEAVVGGALLVSGAALLALGRRVVSTTRDLDNP